MTSNITLRAGLSALQLHLYKSIIGRDLEIINNETTVNDSTLLGTIMQLKQCCCHPYLFEGVEQEQRKKEKAESLYPENTTTHHLIKNCGKLFVMDKLLTKIISNQQKESKILLCSQINEMFEWFEAYCNHRGISHYVITNESNQKELNTQITHASILFYHTSNQHPFNETIKSFSNINTVIFYDTDWTVQDKQERIVKTLEQKCEEKDGLNVYHIYTKDSVEEKIIKIKQKKELNTKELKSLLRYKATKILNISKESTLNMEQNIDDILMCDNEHDSDVEDEDIKVERPMKYSLGDIINHPENQGVIRVFIAFFIGMIIIPIIVVICLNKYAWKYYLLDWSDEGKQNITIVVGVGIAHIIGLIYICYAWSGEDRQPAHILDAKKEDQEEHDKISNEENTVSENGQNVLRQRKTNKKIK